MSIEYCRVSDYRPLYNYYRKMQGAVPYWLDADYETWKQSFISDRDYDGDEMFRELITYTAQHGDEILGFVQFGIPNYLYDTKGEKSDAVRGGIIRMLYLDPEIDCGRKLIRLAEDYFTVQQVQRKFAFFHAFGMTCNAGHGKLYCSLSHIEKALAGFGYVKEHENVYYKRLITDGDKVCSGQVRVEYENMNPCGLQNFSIYAEENWIGSGALVYLPQGKMCYLKWIFIDGKQQGRGYGSAALRRIFADLADRGFERIDTDTADMNTIAQGLYRKTGFEDMGRTRSYYVL